MSNGVPDKNGALEAQRYVGRYGENGQFVLLTDYRKLERELAVVTEHGTEGEHAANARADRAEAALSATRPPVSDDNLRIAFESWCALNKLVHKRKGDGYSSPYADWCWHAFYAASRLAESRKIARSDGSSANTRIDLSEEDRAALTIRGPKP